MIKYDVLNMFSGKVQFTAEIDCEEDAENSWKLRLAVLWAIEHKANMSGADMRYANMRGADLRDANMSGADLRGADMRYANMSGANMIGANMIDANMRGANMIDANIRGADLRDADMRYANMSGANMRGADLRDANMIDANMRYANMSGADMSDANMSGANMIGAKLAVVQTDIWTVYVQPETIRIGCKYHKASEWFAFTDEEISKMEGRALDWWKKWKAAIKAVHETIRTN